MSNFVFVVDANKQALDPIHPGQARRLLKQQRAAVYRRYPFTIILKHVVSEPQASLYELKIDPGSKTTGISIVKNFEEVIWGAELTHRGEQIKNDLQSRKQTRNNRRSRKTRYRRPSLHEWSRIGKKKPVPKHHREGWIAPSLLSRIDNIITWVKRIQKYVPITGISQELVKFDTQKMQNPEIDGKEYQQGTLFGYEVKEYLLEKWGRQCIYCRLPDVPLEVEHIHPRSKGGSSSVSNLTLACRDCNQAKGNQDVKNFLANQPDLLARILAQAKQPLKDAAAVNSTRWALFERLLATGLLVETGTGGRTKYNRTRLGLPKTHWIDSACVGVVGSLRILISKPLLINAKGWGNRQMCTPNKYGFPKSHRTRCKTFYGFQTGDMVKANLPTGKFAGVHVGRVSVRATGVFELNTNRGKITPVRHKYCKAIHRNDGYSYVL